MKHLEKRLKTGKVTVESFATYGFCQYLKSYLNAFQNIKDGKMTSQLNQITKKLDEIDKSKKWFATDAHIKQVIDNQYQEVRIAFYQNPEIQVSGEKINLVEIDLNEIKSLTAALRTACFALEYYQGKLYHADKALEQIAEKLKVL